MARDSLSDRTSRLEPEIPLVAADLWTLYLENANERAKAKAELWDRSLRAFLLFAGLFAGVVSSFVISSASGFQPNPEESPVTHISATVLAINFLWFSSLAVTLISALAAVLAQTWLANFSFISTKGSIGAMERWIHDDRAQKWRLHQAITWITVLIQISLFLFLAGFALQAVVNDRSLGWLIVSLVGLTLVMYLCITVLPWIFPKTPFRTPFSDIGAQSENLDDSLEEFDLLIPTGGKSSSDHSPLGVNVTGSIFKTFLSNGRTLMKTPDKKHVRLGIYSFLLMMNSSKNNVMDAALTELMNVTKDGLTSQDCDSLIEFDLPGTLCLRLIQLCQPRAEQNPAIVQRIKIYLRAIMWIVDENTTDSSQHAHTLYLQLARTFSPLVRSDGPLLKLDMLPSACQAIAFGVRTHLFASGCESGTIQPTNWYTMVENLEPDFALTVFRAAARGLELTKNPGLRHDCASFLAIYLHSDQPIIETTMLKQDSARLVQVLFEQLEQAWKQAMCTNAVHLLAENRFDRQITGLEALTNLAQNAEFRDTIDPLLPALVTTLSSVDWRTSVSCLQKLSKMYEQDTFRLQIRGILPKLVILLSEPLKPVRDAVLHLLDLMDQGELASAVTYFYDKIVRDLKSFDGTTRIGSVRIFTELARTNKMPHIIKRVIPEILACLSFPDDEIRLSVIQILRVLSKQESFRFDIDQSMPQIVKLVRDDAWDVQDEFVDFLSSLAGEAAFLLAINRNFHAIVTDNLISPQWFTRRTALRAFCKLVESGEYHAAITNSFLKVGGMLSDENGNVRESTLQAVYAVADSELSSIMTSDVVVAVSRMFTDGEQTVRVSAFKTFCRIVKLHQIEFKDAIMNIVPVVVSPLTSDWKTQVAVLETLSTLAEIEIFAEMVNDVLDQIIALLLEPLTTGGVHVHVLQTLGALAPKTIFHNKLRNAIPIVTLQIEKKGEVRASAITTLTSFATHGLNFSDVVSQIVSILPEGNTYTSDKVLQLLFNIETQAAHSTTDNASDMAIFRYSLEHIDERVRLAGLRGLHARFKNRPNQKQIALAISDILKRLHDKSENVQVTALDTWFMLKYRTQLATGTSQDQLDVALDDVHKTITALLTSNKESIYAPVIQMLSSFVSSGTSVRRIGMPSPIREFQQEMDGTATIIIKLLANGTDQRRIAMLHTVSDLAKTDMCRSKEFKKVAEHVTSLLSDPKTDVRWAALKTFQVISAQGPFASTVINSVPVLVAAIGKDIVGSFDDIEEVFRIEVLDVLSSLAKQDTYRDEISTKLSEEFVISAIEDRDWSTRVAFLDLLFNLGRQDTLKNLIEQMMPEIGGNLRDDENKSNRMAGVRLLSVPGVKETSYGKLTDLVPTLVNLLSDPEEDIRIAVLRILSELAKQDTFRESINHALPVLEDALRAGDKQTRVAALETWSNLAQEAAFYDRVNSAASHIAACLKDPDFNVRITALAAFSQFSRDEAFRIAVAEAAPNIISQSENPDWETYVYVLRTLRKFSENDAFSDIINSFVPKIVESLQNRDHDVRLEGINLLLTLIQQDIYHRSIQSTLGPAGLSMLIKLIMDRHNPVKLGVLQLLPRVIELDTTVLTVKDTVKELIRLVAEVNPYDSKDLCIAALEALADIARQEVAADFKGSVQKIRQLMKSDGVDNTVRTAALHALSAFSRSNDCVDAIMAIVPTIISMFKDTDNECRQAGTAVILGLARDSKQTSLLPHIFSALNNPDVHIRVLGLEILFVFIKQDTLDMISVQIPTVLNMLEDPEEDIRVAAIHSAVALRALQPTLRKGVTKFHSMIHKEWNNVVAKLQDPDRRIHVAAWDKIPQLARSIWLADDRHVPNIESAIIAALRNSSLDVHLCALQTLSRLAESFGFRAALLRVIPALLASLSDRRNEIRGQSLETLLHLTKYEEFRPRISGQGLHKIISTSKDRIPEVRAASLKVLLKLAQDKLSENIKLTAPHLLTLLRHQSTRRDAVALITCLARDKTTRAGLLSTIRPLLQGEARMLSWGHLLLIANLFKQGKIGTEEPSDLHFALSFITSKQPAVQDFILKFMTTTLQQYFAALAACIQTSKIQLSVQNLMEGKAGHLESSGGLHRPM